jgi:hypothetical protein
MIDMCLLKEWMNEIFAENVGRRVILFGGLIVPNCFVSTTFAQKYNMYLVCFCTITFVYLSLVICVSKAFHRALWEKKKRKRKENPLKHMKLHWKILFFGKYF